MINKLMAFGVFSCVGVTTEVVFTALYPLFSDAIEFDWALSGNSYVWMIFIYGSASIAFPLGFRITSKWNVILRALCYGLVILGVELITGAMFQAFLGGCPWEYQEGWHFNGLIRLDYLPLWMGFGMILEGIHRFNLRAGFAT
jgi:hypothetical protein